MKKIIFILALTLTYTTHAKSTAPILDLDQVNKCSDYQSANLDNDLIGTYRAKDKAKYRENDRLVEINNSGIKKISNWEEIVKHGKKAYFTEQELNDMGYCLKQTVTEKNNAIELTVSINRSVNNIFLNVKQLNKVSIVFESNKLPTYLEKHVAFGRALIIPAYSGSSSGKLTLEKISLKGL